MSFSFQQSVAVIYAYFVWYLFQTQYSYILYLYYILYISTLFINLSCNACLQRNAFSDGGGHLIGGAHLLPGWFEWRQERVHSGGGLVQPEPGEILHRELKVSGAGPVQESATQDDDQQFLGLCELPKHSYGFAFHSYRQHRPRDDVVRGVRHSDQPGNR